MQGEGEEAQEEEEEGCNPEETHSVDMSGPVFVQVSISICRVS